MFPDYDDEEDEEPSAPIVPAGVHLAPIWRRAVGLLLDQLLLVTPVIAVFAALGDAPHDALSGEPGRWFNVAITGLALVYETVCVWRWGRSVGKLVMGTRVVHVLDGGRVGFSAALIRALVPAAFGVIPQIGTLLGLGVYLLALFDPRRQGLHDKAAGTLVGLSRHPQ